MGRLVIGRIDFNDPDILSRFERAVQSLVSDSRAYCPLEFKPAFYFWAGKGMSITTQAGWYIILNDKIPLYVGQAEDLEARLNSNQGSLDNFAKLNRGSDAERNFIKKFSELGRLPALRACLMIRRELAQLLGLSESELKKIDVDNIERVLNILRGEFTYL